MKVQSGTQPIFTAHVETIDASELPTLRLPPAEMDALVSRTRRLRTGYSPIDANGSPFWAPIALPRSRESAPTLVPAPAVAPMAAPITAVVPLGAVFRPIAKEHAWWEPVAMNAAASTWFALVYALGLWIRAGGDVWSRGAQVWRLPVTLGLAGLSLQIAALAVLAFKRSVRGESQSHDQRSWWRLAAITAALPVSGVGLACGADSLMVERGVLDVPAVVALILASTAIAVLLVRAIAFDAAERSE